MYEAAIEYGKMVRNTAKVIADSDDIYKAADNLPYDMRAYFLMSSTAFFIVYPNIEYEHEIVAQVIQDFILSENIDQYIISNPDLDKSKKYEFILKNREDFFSMMENIKEDITALTIISHAKDFGEEKVTWAVYRIADRLKPTLANKAAWYYSYDTLFPTDQKDEVNSQTTKNQEQDKKTLKPDEDSPLFETKDDKQCIDVYYFLIDTKVLDKCTTSLPSFLNAIAHADMSSITPKAKTRFRSAVARLKWAIKGDANLWARIACKSIGHTPSSAAGNSTNSGAWFDDLCKLLPDNGNKK